jgi:hypothetical protein
MPRLARPQKEMELGMRIDRPDPGAALGQGRHAAGNRPIAECSGEKHQRDMKTRTIVSCHQRPHSPAARPQEILLGFYTDQGDGEHRVYWGNNLIQTGGRFRPIG